MSRRSTMRSFGPARRPIHQARLRLLRPERESRNEVRAEVDGENLHDNQRERDVEHDL